ncbi:hypothetical protein N7533_011695 [Penicillium manginii]|uniref:uncharacterized protein n=1 Tax=Penicillium manginii TaxID=203109 RepID=UPI002548231F|nr:uncharacterized protein N7533_011695 [Penicillium manginii]KAJ5742286.1 hypothetical protein N7533_011695 [Penicillium manginii]
MLLTKNLLRQVVCQFSVCVSFVGIGHTSLGDPDCRLMFQFQTDDDELNIIESFLRILLSVLLSTVLFGRLISEEQCVGGWLFADQAHGESLRLENQPTTTYFDESEDGDDPRPQFMSSEPIYRNAPPEGLSHLTAVMIYGQMSFITGEILRLA